MSADVATFTAACPRCGDDAEWNETRHSGYLEGAPRIRIVCGSCGDSDPVAGLVAVIKTGIAS